MKLNWGVVFAGISAAAGVAYVVTQTRNKNIAPVTNIFPPLNTPDFFPPSASMDEPVTPQTIPTQTTSQSTQPHLTPYPVFLV